EVDDGEVQAFVLEVTQLLGNRERQVIEEVLAAHGDGALGFLQALREGEIRQAGGGDAAGNEVASLHVWSPVCVKERGARPLAGRAPGDDRPWGYAGGTAGHQGWP